MSKKTFFKVFVNLRKKDNTEKLQIARPHDRGKSQGPIVLKASPMGDPVTNTMGPISFSMFFPWGTANPL
jgi:hypothetical protein